MSDDRAGHSASDPATRHQPSHENAWTSSDREELLTESRRLEAELERYRAHAERTSKLFLAATDYAEWVRERARNDAEHALRKARARANKLLATALQLEETERKFARQQAELERLESLTDETRKRLSAFLSTGLELLNADEEATPFDDPASVQEDLQDTLHQQLSATPPPRHVSEVESQESPPTDHWAQ